MQYGPLLIVEDSDDDFYAIRQALGTTLPCPLARCGTGSEALDDMFRRGAYAQAARPYVKFLDARRSLS